MRECVAVLDDAARLKEERVASFECLQMLCEQIDNAANVEKIGLWPSIVALIDEHGDVDLCTWALVICATCAKNNDAPQTVLGQQYGLLARAMALLGGGEAVDERIRQKALHLISALIQHHDENMRTFIEGNGFGLFEALLAAAGDDSSTLMRAMADRIAFIVAFLCREHAQFKDLFAKFPRLCAAVEAFAFEEDAEVRDEVEDRVGEQVDQNEEDRNLSN